MRTPPPCPFDQNSVAAALNIDAGDRRAAARIAAAPDDLRLMRVGRGYAPGRGAAYTAAETGKHPAVPASAPKLKACDRCGIEYSTLFKCKGCRRALGRTAGR
jgi:hypothetical protein